MAGSCKFLLLNLRTLAVIKIAAPGIVKLFIGEKWRGQTRETMNTTRIWVKWLTSFSVSLSLSSVGLLLSLLGRKARLPDVPFHIRKWKICFTRGKAQFQISEHVTFFLKVVKRFQYGQIFSREGFQEADLRVLLFFCSYLLNQSSPAAKAPSSIVLCIAGVRWLLKIQNTLTIKPNKLILQEWKKEKFFIIRERETKEQLSNLLSPKACHFMVCFVRPLSQMTWTGAE